MDYEMTDLSGSDCDPFAKSVAHVGSLVGEEKLKQIRLANYKKLKYRPCGLQTKHTKRLEEDLASIRSYRFDFICRKIIQDAEFEKYLINPFYWSREGYSWKSSFLENADPPSDMKRLGFYKNGKPIGVDIFVMGVLSSFQHHYSDEYIMKKVPHLLKIEMEYLIKLGILVILFEVTQIPTRLDQLEYILCTLLQMIRSNNIMGIKCKLVLKFDLRSDEESRKCLTWYRGFRESVNERDLLRPSVRIFQDLPPEDCIQAWIREKPAHVFISKSLFKLNKKNAPYLESKHERVMLQFMQVMSLPTIQDFDVSGEPDMSEMTWIRDYINYTWGEFLQTGRL